MTQDPGEPRFQEIYGRHLAAVRAYVRRRAPAELVEEVVSETFLVCWRRMDRVPDDPLPWLYAVARRTLANERRKRDRSPLLHVAPRHAEPVLAGDAVLAKAFAALAEADQEVLCLVAWEGLALREAAVVLGCSAVACRVRYHRARRRLAERLGELEAEPASRAEPCPHGATP
jgi:RNA polymerase sigma-70 factor, ECF subfamily